MAISTSLIAKGIAGTLSLAAPVATSVYYKDNIYKFFVSKTEEESLKIGSDTTGKINLTYKENGTCSITVESSNLQTVKDKLNGLLGSSNLNENNKRYRRGLIKKCKDSSNNLSISVSDANNIDLSTLFDLSTAELNEEEKKLASNQWSLTSAVETDKFTATITVSDGSQGTSGSISVGTCKIIGEKGTDGESIESSHLTSSKDEIETSIKNETDKTNNPEGKKSFLTKCKKNFNNEIKLKLKKTTSEGNTKYSLENLSSEFQSTQGN